MDTDGDIIWDPVGEKIAKDDFEIQKKVLLKKAANYKNDPSLIIKYLVILVILPIGVFLWRIQDLNNKLSWTIIELSIIPLIYYFLSTIHLQDDLILYLLCEDNHWVFNPAEGLERIQKLLTVYPQIFNKERNQHNKKIVDQIWGNLQKDSKIIDFWRCTFQYTVGSGKSSTYERAVFILKLNRNIQVPFSLEKADILSKFVASIKTESEEFNKLFQIVSENTDEETKMQIIRILSPSVQVRLIKFAQTLSIETIRFQDNTMTIVFEDEIWRPVFTNFFKKVVIDERDKSLFFQSLVDMAELPTEMLQFID